VILRSRAGVDLSPYLAHHVTVMGNEGSVLGTASMLPHVGIRDRLDCSALLHARYAERP
jgi:hypothetical protein